MLLPNVSVGKRLQCGTGKPIPLGIGKKEIRGSAYIQSPMLIGNPDLFPNVESPVMIGPINNPDSSIPWICEDDEYKFIPEWDISPCGASREGSIKGEELYNSYTLVVKKGDHKTSSEKCKPGGAEGENPKTTITEGESSALFYGDVDIKGNLRVYDPERENSLSVIGNADISKDIIAKENILSGKNVFVGKDLVAEKEVMSNCGAHILSSKKNFDIPHPSKEGWRLRHTCLEGPSNDIYLRGQVRNKNYIDLPLYWKDFVNKDSITVTLTPIGSHQSVIVKGIVESKIYLQSNGGMPIHCYYHIFAERKDGEKLIPEYKGLTPNDYPGDNSEYNINSAL
jgi:hypothetical protein